MSYRLDVMDSPQFERFLNEVVLNNVNWDLDTFLAPYHARNCVGTPFIEFETQAHAVMFVLRWS